jgi:hypothetical protein
VENTPTTYCRKVEEQVGVPKSRVQEILRKHKLKPYKFRLVQNFHPGDAGLNFCNWYIHHLDIDNNFYKKIIWPHEAFISSLEY